MKKAHLPKLSDKTAPNATTTTSFPQLLVVSLTHKPWVQGVEGGTRVKVVKASDLVPVPDWKSQVSILAAKVIEIIRAWHSKGPLTVLIVVYDAVVAARFGAALALSKEQLPPVKLLIVKSVKEQQKSNQLVCNIAEAVPLW